VGVGKRGSEGGATKGQMGQAQFCNTCHAIAGHRQKDIAMKKLPHVDGVKFELGDILPNRSLNIKTYIIKAYIMIYNKDIWGL
jgi:hypothetical protein